MLESTPSMRHEIALVYANGCRNLSRQLYRRATAVKLNLQGNVYMVPIPEIALACGCIAADKVVVPQIAKGTAYERPTTQSTAQVV